MCNPRRGRDFGFGRRVKSDRLLATAHAIFLALEDQDVNAIRSIIMETYGYDLSRSVDDIRLVHEYNETAFGCVPEALTCALEAADYEDALRNAVSLGGDADTLAAIAGGLAEALFDIPDELREAGLGYLPDSMKAVMADMYRCRDASQSARTNRPTG